MKKFDFRYGALAREFLLFFLAHNNAVRKLKPVLYAIALRQGYQAQRAIPLRAGSAHDFRMTNPAGCARQTARSYTTDIVRIKSYI